MSRIADILHVSVPTVKRRFRRFNLTRSASYSDMSDSALDEMVKEIVVGNDLLGPEAVRAQLRSQGIWVQRCRVRECMRRIDPRAAALRTMSQRLHRRAYRVAGPNSLWHLDGNHKLIRWRIVIHGGIDGYSRLIVFLRASNNNRSSTVMDCFMHGVTRFGMPSRVRTDYGGENTSVWLMMNILRGSERGSALRGRSTHNQRIERLWGDVWRGLTNVYYDLFNFLESDGVVDIDNEMHLWALHYVYLPRLNRDIVAFVQQWNNHGLRTERHQSPLQLFVRGCVEQQGRPSTAMQDIFGARTAPEGGVHAAGAIGGDNDPDGAGAVEASASERLVVWSDRVTVPPNQYMFESSIIEELEARFDPLSGPRDRLGLDILHGVLSFLGSLPQQ
ncbi:uncharacterized protein LOC116684911 [Etheostoma spectabile]|uniref:uncharacterized protein LOC116684911 n=1 Tax=Etheostoma spectabile TaxID=54343 RepID=UPI0013AEC1A6|nr:uncharacterized protein LOC116684911 [Etheostoma spectabile]